MRTYLCHTLYTNLMLQMVFSVVISAPVYLIYLILGLWFLFQALLELPLVLCTKHKAYKSVHFIVYVYQILLSGILQISSYSDSNNHYYNHVRGLFKRSVLTICFRNTTVTLQYRTDRYIRIIHLNLSYPCLAPRKLVPVERVFNIHTLRNYLKRGLGYIIPYHKGFSYPLPFTSALSMAVLVIYQVWSVCVCVCV